MCFSQSASPEDRQMKKKQMAFVSFVYYHHPLLILCFMPTVAGWCTNHSRNVRRALNNRIISNTRVPMSPSHWGTSVSIYRRVNASPAWNEGGSVYLCVHVSVSTDRYVYQCLVIDLLKAC